MPDSIFHIRLMFMSPIGSKVTRIQVVILYPMRTLVAPIYSWAAYLIMKSLAFGRGGVTLWCHHGIGSIRFFGCQTGYAGSSITLICII